MSGDGVPSIVGAAPETGAEHAPASPGDGGNTAGSSSEQLPTPSASTASGAEGAPGGDRPASARTAPGDAGRGDGEGSSRARTFAPNDAPDASTRRATRILAGLLAAAVTLSLAGWLWWRLVPDAPPAPPLPEPVPAPASATTYEDAVAIAQAQADRWLPGARLLNATMQVDWPWRVPTGRVTDLPATGWVTAIFLAPWDAPPGRNETAASLSVVLERLSRQIVLQETLGWETAAIPPATPTPGIDSTVASILAERGGGTEFRRACPELRHLSRIGLVSNAPGFPQHWLVTYEDSRRPEAHGLLLRIDAATGAVVGRAQDAPPCQGAEAAG